MKNCLGVSPIASQLNNKTMPTQTPVSSGGNESLTSPLLLSHHIFMNQAQCDPRWTSSNPRITEM